jgi:hypothetical protein
VFGKDWEKFHAISVFCVRQLCAATVHLQFGISVQYVYIFMWLTAIADSSGWENLREGELHCKGADTTYVGLWLAEEINQAHVRTALAQKNTLSLRKSNWSFYCVLLTNISF